MASKIRILSFSLILCFMPVILFAGPQETRVNQKKIEKERAKKKKQSVDEYNKAVRRHNNMQSKTTKASMKRTKKASKKATPSMH
ncbi:MAG: hypothetical protein ACOYNC_08075 [Bacteroidales bacterium]